MENNGRGLPEMFKGADLLRKCVLPCGAGWVTLGQTVQRRTCPASRFPCSGGCSRFRFGSSVSEAGRWVWSCPGSAPGKYEQASIKQVGRVYRNVAICSWVFSDTRNCKNLPLLYKNITWDLGWSIKALCSCRMYFIVGDLLNFEAERCCHTPRSV